MPPDSSDAARFAPTTAEIDLVHLRHNVRVLQNRAGTASLMGVVKANAYGHGAVRIVRVLQEEGVRYFAVATLPEAIQLREAGITAPVLVFGAPLPSYLPAYARHTLDLTVTSRTLAEAVADAARRHGPLRVHLEVDTGMGRLGMDPDEAPEIVRLLRTAPQVTLAGLWTHFATADELDDTFAMEQLARFRTVLASVGDVAEHVHTANSAALLTLPESCAFARPLVRTGIALYGLGNRPVLMKDLRPVMRLTSRVTHVKTVATGTSISYGRRWRAPYPTRIATVNAGYADGYPRLLSNRAEVGIGGRRYPVAGAVCMDMFMVDLGAPDGPGGTVAVGDEVVLFGTGGPSALEVADWAETIPYEICSAVSSRVPRHYRAASSPR